MLASLPLPQPKGAQKEVVYLNSTGHTVVLGTAGSGKTTMAVLRARWLADEAPSASGPTLLVTFNKALVTYLKQSHAAVGSRLTVETYHKFARGYLSSRGQMSYNCICNDPEWYISRAIAHVRHKGFTATVLDRPIKFFRDELHWIAGHGMQSASAYARADRIGRMRPLQSHDREAVFAVRNEYIEQRAHAGFRYDWDDLATAVLQELAHDNSERRYKHIIVDEGQDFTPQMMRSLAAAFPSDGSLTFFGDYAQQMYGSRMSWKSIGLNVSAPVEFRQNYRNSRQIARLALAMSGMPHFPFEHPLHTPGASQPPHHGSH